MNRRKGLSPSAAAPAAAGNAGFAGETLISHVFKVPDPCEEHSDCAIAVAFQGQWTGRNPVRTRAWLERNVFIRNRRTGRPVRDRVSGALWSNYFLPRMRCSAANCQRVRHRRLRRVRQAHRSFGPRPRFMFSSGRSACSSRKRVLQAAFDVDCCSPLQILAGISPAAARAPRCAIGAVCTGRLCP